jgi:hypothetical protein
MLYSCPRSLIESWWIAIEQGGFHVEVQPPLSVPVIPERNGFRYRRGTVRQQDAVVEIWACPGPYPPSTSPLSGKHLLALQFKKSSQLSEDLARAIGKLLSDVGCRKINPPGEPQEGLEGAEDL